MEITGGPKLRANSSHLILRGPILLLFHAGEPLVSQGKWPGQEGQCVAAYHRAAKLHFGLEGGRRFSLRADMANKERGNEGWLRSKNG